MAHQLYAFLTTLGVMTVIDAVWLGLIAPSFYKKYIGFLMADKPNWLAAALFYVIYVIGITVFVVYPGWKDSYPIIKVALLGGLLGLVAYATYDLTNQATIKNWPLTVTVVDLIWGTVLTASVATIAVLVLKNVIK